MGILDGKRILVAGVTMDSSIGFATAKVAQEQGATVLISNFGRALGITKRIAKRLPDRAAGARAGRDRPRAPRAAARRWSASTSTASTAWCTRSPTATPRRCWAASSCEGPWPDVAQAVQVSAYSLKSLATACRPLMGQGGSVVGLTFDATVAWPAYDWMGVAKAGLESCSRYLARDLGPTGIRVNLVSAGPLQDAGRQGDPGLRGARGDVERPRAAGLGRAGPRADRPGGRARCCRTSSRRPPARSSTSTAASTRWAPETPSPGAGRHAPGTDGSVPG